MRATRARTVVALIAAVLSTAAPLLVSSAAADDYEPTTLVHPPFGHCLGLHRASAFHLFLYLGTRTRFNEPAGLAAVKLDVHDDPSTTSDDDELTVFGLNSGECEIIYNTSLVSVDIYGECGTGTGQFMNPMGIAADRRGNVFVADTGNDRVVRLLYEDGGLRHVKSFGSQGVGDGHFDTPSHIAVGESGNLYVSDTGNDRVVVMSPVGEWLAELRGDADAGVVLEGPIGVAAVEADDPWISRKRDFIVVADRGGTRLVKLTRDGRVSATASTAELPFEASFDHLAIDFYGSVYATDTGESRIHKFDWRLDYVTSVGRPGTGDMELDEPRGITLWRRFGQIFVTERAGAQYFWIGTEIQDASVEPSSVVPGGEIRVRYFLTEVARVDIELVDEDGKLVHTLVRNRRRTIGENVERWDGTFGGGRRGAGRDSAPDRGPVPAGTYSLRITATPTYSSGEYFHDTAEIPGIVVEPAAP